MKLFSDGTYGEDTDPRDNTFSLGKPDGGSTVIGWQFPPDNRADQELIISCQLISHGYFAAYPGSLESHMGFMLRSVISDIPAGKYKGVGPIFGKVWCGTGVPPYVTGTYPCFQIEEWGNTIVPPTFEYLRTNSNSPTVHDGVRYRLWMSCKRFAGEVYSRYVVGMLNSGSQYTPFFDTGDVQSNNWAMDRNNEALSLFDVGNSPGNAKVSDYTLEVVNLNAHQIPAYCRIPDQRFSGNWVRP